MKHKKIIIPLIVSLVLGCCGAGAYGIYALLEKRKEDNKQEPTKPDDSYLEDFDVQSNSAQASKDVELTQVKNDELTQYIIDHASEDKIPLTRDQYIELAKKDIRNAEKPTFFYDANNNVIYGGSLESKFKNYYLVRSDIDELYDSLDYNVSSKDEVVEPVKDENPYDKDKKNIKVNGSDMHFGFKFDAELASFEKEFNDTEKLKLSLKNKFSGSIDLSNLSVSLKFIPLPIPYIDFKFNYDYDLKVTNEFSFNATLKRVLNDEEEYVIREYGERLRDAVQNPNNNARQFEFEDLDISNPTNMYPDISKFLNEHVKGIRPRTVEVEICCLELPPCSLGGFEQVLNQIVCVPIIAYFDLNGNVSFKLSSKIRYECSGGYEYSYNNLRRNQFQTKETKDFEHQYTEDLSMSVEALLDIKVGLAMQLNLFDFDSVPGKRGGFKIFEFTVFFEMKIYGKASFALRKVNNLKATYYSGAIGYSLDLVLQFNFKLEFKYLPDIYKTSNLLKIPLIGFDIKINNETNGIGKIDLYYGGFRIPADKWLEYGFNFEDFLNHLPLTNNSRKVIEADIKRSMMKEARIEDLEAEIDYDNKKVVIRGTYIAAKNIKLRGIKVLVGPTEYEFKDSEIEMTNKMFTLTTDLPLDSATVDIVIETIEVSFDELRENVVSNAKTSVEIDLSVLKPVKIDLLTTGDLYDDSTIQVGIDLENPLEFNVGYVIIAVGDVIYKIEEKDFIKDSLTRIIVEFTLRDLEVSHDTITKNIELKEVYFTNGKLEHIATDYVDPIEVTLISTGDGTIEYPFKIYENRHLKKLHSGIDSNAILMNDLDLNGTEITTLESFKSSFDGQGFSLNYMNLDSEANTSLFGVLEEGAVVKNLNIKRSSTSGKTGSSFISNINKGTIENVTFDNCKSRSDDNTTFVTNENYGTIKNINVTNSVIKSFNEKASFISILNVNGGQIIDTNVLDSTLEGNNNVAALAVTNSGLITNTYLETVRVHGENNLAGAIVTNNGTYKDSKIADLHIFGNDNIGGCAVINKGEISNLDIYLSLIIGNDNISGVASENSGTITNIIDNESYIEGNNGVSGVTNNNSGTLTGISITKDNIIGKDRVSGISNSSTTDISNIVIKDTVIEGANDVSGIANSTIGNISVVNLSNVKISGTENVSGVVSHTTGNINKVDIKDSTIESKNNASGVTLTTTADISDVNLTNVKISGLDNVSGLANETSGNVNNVNINKVTITGTNNVSGLLLGNNKSITNVNLTNVTISGTENVSGVVSHTTGNINKVDIKDSTIESKNNASGLTLTTTADISDVNLTNVKISGLDNVSGLANETSGNVNNVNINKVTITGTNNVSGLVLGNNKSITNVNLTNVTINGENNVCAIANGTSTGNIKNIVLKELTIKGNENLTLIANINKGTISDITISNIKLKSQGKISAIISQNDGEISNLDISNLEVLGGDNSSIVASDNNGTISNVKLNKVTLSGGNYVSLICSNNTGSISLIDLNNVTLKGGRYVGTIASTNTGSIKDIKGNTIHVDGESFVGGIVATNRADGSVSNVLIENVFVQGVNNVGGAIGNNSGNLLEIRIDFGDIHGVDGVGGIVGTNKEKGKDSTLDLMSFTGNVTGHNYVGGIIGDFQSGKLMRHYISSDNIIKGEKDYGNVIGRLGYGVIVL